LVEAEAAFHCRCHQLHRRRERSHLRARARSAGGRGCRRRRRREESVDRFGEHGLEGVVECGAGSRCVRRRARAQREWRQTRRRRAHRTVAEALCVEFQFDLKVESGQNFCCQKSKGKGKHFFCFFGGRPSFGPPVHRNQKLSLELFLGARRRDALRFSCCRRGCAFRRSVLGAVSSEPCHKHSRGQATPAERLCQGVGADLRHLLTSRRSCCAARRSGRRSRRSRGRIRRSRGRRNGQQPVHHIRAINAPGSVGASGSAWAVSWASCRTTLRAGGDGWDGGRSALQSAGGDG